MTPPAASRPDEVMAVEIARAQFGADVASCVRFPTGLHHWVYDIVLADGRTAVVRVGAPESRDAIAGGVRWTERLRAVGVAVAGVVAADVDAPYPFMVLERLPGTDLGNVYDELSVAARRRISRRVVAMQRATAGLGDAAGFGYAVADDSPPAPTWDGVLQGSLHRSRLWIVEADVVDPGWADRVEQVLDLHRGGFADVTPTPFLHDVTTKNVIVHEAAVSGIVDVDSMAYGDPLWTTALTAMSLLAARRPTDYLDAQFDAFDPGRLHRQRFALYTALHGLAFLGELGRAFNRSAVAVDRGERERLEGLLADLLEQSS